MANKKRLIDANALLAEIQKLREIPPKVTSFTALNVIASIKNAPTVDAVEVVHGEWSTIEDDYCGLVALHCSVCNHEWWFEDDVPIKHYHYCPNCGAKMYGGNEDG